MWTSVYEESSQVGKARIQEEWQPKLEYFALFKSFPLFLWENFEGKEGVCKAVLAHPAPLSELEKDPFPGNTALNQGTPAGVNPHGDPGKGGKCT